MDKIETRNNLSRVAGRIISGYSDNIGINLTEQNNLPGKEQVKEVFNILYSIIFPGYSGEENIQKENISFIIDTKIKEVYWKLNELIIKALHSNCPEESCENCSCRQRSEKTVIEFMDNLPFIRELLKIDVKAAYSGDPAAKSMDEIILSYPFIYSIVSHRIAHALYILEVPLIPRMISEMAHSLTGIDIHPGAQIGESFFIDHGTGVVIGETTIIGKNVKIYQGVTLGALSIPYGEQEKTLISSHKRHPTIEDNVIIYSEATILGGKTIIGKNSIIGGNVWITKSVPPNTKIISEKSKTITKHIS